MQQPDWRAASGSAVEEAKMNILDKLKQSYMNIINDRLFKY